MRVCGEGSLKPVNHLQMDTCSKWSHKTIAFFVCVLDVLKYSMIEILNIVFISFCDKYQRTIS
jgi:hypothetical protein